MLLKSAEKGGAVSESAGGADLLDGKGGGFQQFDCFLQSGSGNILGYCDSVQPMKHPA